MITIPFGIVLFCSFLVLACYTVLTIRLRPSAKAVTLPADPPLVSILLPIRHIDDDMKANLEALFLLNYPRYELLVAADEESDPCVAVLHELQRRYPTVPTRVIAAGYCNSVNPKVFKLSRLEEISSGTLFWVVDSNVRVEADTLDRLVAGMQEKNAHVLFCPIRATGSRTIGSIVENANINFFLSGNVVSAWKLFRQHITVGKSLLIERRALERFGGFRYFLDYLAEDFMLGESFRLSRFAVATNYTWVTAVSRSTTLRSFRQRAARWALLRFRLKPHVYVLEIVLNPIVLCLPAPLWLGGWGGRLLLGVTLAKIVLEFLNFLFINTADRGNIRTALLFPFCVILKDLLLFEIYLTPFFRRSVTWREGRISVGRKTLIAGSQDKLLLEGA